MFPATRTSIVDDMLSDDPMRRDRSILVITRAYWKPVYKYLRLRWRLSVAEAEDVTQSFFETVIARDMLAAYRRERAAFRTFLRACLDRHAIDQHRRSIAGRRGGGNLPVDFTSAEAEIGATRSELEDPIAIFDAEWLRNLMQRAMERFEAKMASRGRPLVAVLFRQFHFSEAPPSYAAAAEQHGIAVTDVTNWLHAARREFRKSALELLAELTIDEEDYAAEARSVFGIDVSGRE